MEVYASDTAEAFLSPFFACGEGDAAALALLEGGGDVDSLGLAGEGGSLFFKLGATPANLAARLDIVLLDSRTTVKSKSKGEKWKLCNTACIHRTSAKVRASAKAHQMLLGLN